MTASSFIRSGSSGVDPVAFPAGRAQLGIDLVRVVAALAGDDQHVHALSSATSAIASFTASVDVPIAGPRAAHLRRREEHRLDDGRNRAPRCMRCSSTEPTIPRQPIEPTSHTCARSLYSAATTASPISCGPTLRVPGVWMSAVASRLAALRHRALDALGRFGLVERVAQHHRRREDRRQRVGQALPGDVGRASRGSARRGPCRAASSDAEGSMPIEPAASTPRRTGCRRTCCR